MNPITRALVIAIAAVLTAAIRSDASQKAPARKPEPSRPHMKSTNARDYYDQAISLITNDWVVGEGWLEPPPAATWEKPQTDSQLAAAAKANLPVLEAVREGFASPYVAGDDWYESHIVMSAHDRDLSRVLSFEGQEAAHVGHRDDAIGIYVDDMRYGSDLWKGGGMMGAFDGTACVGIGRRRAWDVAGRVSAQAAKTAARRIQAIDAAMPTTASMLQVERRAVIAGDRKLISKPGWRKDFTADMIAGRVYSSAPYDANALPAQVNAVSDTSVLSTSIQFEDAEIARASLPYSAYLKSPPPALPGNVVSSHLLFPQPTLRRDRDCCYVLDELLATELALRAYHLDHGRYPTRILDLTPRYLASVPLDPFADGRPLTYRPAGSTYLLYSFGPDGKDDGGKPIDNGGGRLRYQVRANMLYVHSQTGDIIAGINF